MDDAKRIATTIWFDPEVRIALILDKATKRGGISMSDIVNEVMRVALDLPEKATP